MKFKPAAALAAVAVLFSVSAAPMAPNGEASAEGTQSLKTPKCFRVLTALSTDHLPSFNATKSSPATDRTCHLLQ